MVKSGIVTETNAVDQTVRVKIDDKLTAPLPIVGGRCPDIGEPIVCLLDSRGRGVALGDGAIESKYALTAIVEVEASGGTANVPYPEGWDDAIVVGVRSGSSHVHLIDAVYGEQSVSLRISDEVGSLSVMLQWV